MNCFIELTGEEVSMTEKRDGKWPFRGKKYSPKKSSNFCNHLFFGLFSTFPKKESLMSGFAFFKLFC